MEVVEGDVLVAEVEVANGVRYVERLRGSVCIHEHVWSESVEGPVQDGHQEATSLGQNFGKHQLLVYEGVGSTSRHV